MTTAALRVDDARVHDEVELTTVEARPTAVVAATTTWQEFPLLWGRLLGEVWDCLRASGIDRGCRNVMLYRDDVPNVEVGILLDRPCPLTGRVTASITRRLIERFVSTPAPTDDGRLDRLTDRELDVLRLVAQGLSNAEIAEELYVSHGMVKTRVARVLMKLGLRDRVQAVIFAYETGVVSLGAARKPHE